jgi:glucose/arabinose dehydrogenase
MRPASLFLALLLPAAAAAQTVDTDYHVVDLIPSGLSSPRALTFLPDGRVLVAEKATGRIRVIKNGVLLAAPFADVPVNSAGDRGALGIAAAPDFASSHAVYLLYTRSSTGLDTAAPAQIAEFRLARFTASGDTALAGSETVVRGFPWDATLITHIGGGLRFGPEGALYVGLGTADAPSNPAPALDQLRGKLLRLVPATGAAWPDNSFAVDGDPATLPEIFSFGLHDPASIAAYFYDQPGPPKILVTDTGDGANDEVDEAVNGKDYGYPVVQGEADQPAESAYVATHVRYRPAAWTSGAASVSVHGVAAAMADYGFFPVPTFWWGEAAGILGVGRDAFTLPKPALVEEFGHGFPKIADLSFPIRFPMPFLPDFDTLYVAAGDRLYLVRKNGTTAAPSASPGIALAHAGTHPAAGGAGIACTLPAGAHARLEIVDLRGRIVATPARDLTGTRLVRWRTERAGLYFARLILADGTMVARLKLVLL